MAVFRVAKTKDYTVMSNYHLKDGSLSLKAKGLLSVMLSLPDDWDYTLKGLSIISKEGIDAIREAVRELEKAGYILRARSRNEKGQLKGTEYVIYERPQPVADTPVQEKPVLAKPTLENPTQAFPAQAEPTQENPTQLNTIRQSKTYISKTHESNPYQSKRANSADGYDGMDSGVSERDIRRLRDEVREQISYDDLVEPHNRAQMDEIVEIMVETLASRREHISVSGEEHPAWLVQERLRKINGHHIEYIFDCLNKNRTKIHNIRKYLLATLFNAPVTMENYYDNAVRHAGLI